MAIEELRKSDMMAHLLDALNRGQDIGHYGRLVFVMVARYFMDDDELVRLLCQDKDFSEEQARAMVEQVHSRGYSPPRRERVLDWQARQDFVICPNADDPDSANVYKDLQFPPQVYDHIEEYHEQKSEAQHAEQGG